MTRQKISLSHGSGGSLTQDLIKEAFLKKLNNPILKELADSATINYKEKIAFTTDSFVVSPWKFKGADIGKLAVCGTVNDLVVSAAIPRFLSLGCIIEEGLDYSVLEQIVDSISSSAKKAGVVIVTGDLKVVERGACDKIFINTSGLGKIIRRLSIGQIKKGDAIIITGNIAEHGLAVLAARKGLDFNIKSDCASLNDLLIPILNCSDAIKFMRDPTRGGVATTLNEITQASGLGIIINEKNIPISPKVRAAAELLGIDPLYVANEGKAILVVKKGLENKILNLLKTHPLGKNAAAIGNITNDIKKQVILKTSIGSWRILDILTNEPLPRIC